ncbi:MAG: DEAD/DEAH box helicase family protein [Candidatus Kerfeldbacteria bacterium]|nr:DEAD/DEAH box helicase family protein [Candidatus Kerfeldbacteria bacterium]
MSLETVTSRRNNSPDQPLSADTLEQPIATAMRYFDTHYFSTLQRRVDQCIAQLKADMPVSVEYDIAYIQADLKREQEYCHQLISQFVRWTIKVKQGSMPPPTIVWDEYNLDHPAFADVLKFQKEIARRYQIEPFHNGLITAVKYSGDIPIFNDKYPAVAAQLDAQLLQDADVIDPEGDYFLEPRPTMRASRVDQSYTKKALLLQQIAQIHQPTVFITSNHLYETMYSSKNHAQLNIPTVVTSDQPFFVSRLASVKQPIPDVPGTVTVHKTEAQLAQQLHDMQRFHLGADEAAALVPPFVQEDIMAMPDAELKTKFKLRYDMYVKLLRHDYEKAIAGGEDIETKALSTDELVSMRRWLTALNSLDSYINAHKENEDNRTLKEKQFTIFENLRNFIEAGGTAGYLKLPTGFGKTVMFIELLEALNLKCLIVVPTKVLLRQTGKRIDQFAPKLDYGRVYGAAKQFGRQCTIITYDSLSQKLNTGKLNPDDYDCVILDEVHTALSVKRKRAVGRFDKALKLGFTATAEFSDERSVQELLPHEIHRMNITEAVDEEILCPYIAPIMRTEVDISKVKISADGELNEEDLALAVNIESRNIAAVELYQQALADQTAVVYCVGIQHAKTMADKFNAAGVVAAAISGKTPEKEQIAILESFERGDIKVICNADLLIAGFDEPRAAVCLNLRPTFSRVIAEQRGGRVLRLNELDPEKFAFIIDFLDKNLPEDFTPVLFAEVATGAYRESNRSRFRIGRTLPQISIAGLEVIMDADEVMRIVSGLQEKRKRVAEKEKKFLPFDELQKEVQALEIRSRKAYWLESPRHSNWPSRPDEFYRDQWPQGGWLEFLAKFLSFEDLRHEVQALGIHSSKAYQLESPRHSNWPNRPDKFYRDQWPGWPKFLGKE